MGVAHVRSAFIPNPARGSRVLVSPAVLAVIGSNLIRRPARTMLTAIGIALGVATIVALLSVTSGLKRSAGDLIHLGDADIGIFQKGVADPTSSLLPDNLGNRLQRTAGVQAATPLLLVVEGISQQPSAIVFGMDPTGFVAHREVYLQGRFPAAPHQIGIGNRLAGQLHARPGSSVKVMGKTFTVSGVYQSGTFFEDSGATLPLKSAQALARRFGEATTVAIVLRPGTRTATVRQAILRGNPDLQAIASPDDAARAGGNSQLIGKAVLVIVVLALIIGGIAVANTMAMAVLERQGEFALMATIGWSPGPRGRAGAGRGRGGEPDRRRPGPADRGGRRPRDERRGEIGAAAAQRRDLSLWRGADVAGEHRHDAAGKKRCQHPLRRAVGARVVGRGVTEGLVGVDDLERVDIRRPGARGAERGGHQTRAQPLAAGNEIVGRARREVAKESKALRQRLELVEGIGDLREHLGTGGTGGEQDAGDFRMPRPEAGNERRDGTGLAGPGLLRHGEERVGGPRHRRDDHDGGLRTVATDDVDGVADGGGIGQRRTAELVHMRCSACSGHRGERIMGAVGCWLLAVGLTRRSSR